MKLKSLSIFTLTIYLSACSSNSQQPKQPNNSKRIPINKTVPIELES